MLYMNPNATCPRCLNGKSSLIKKADCPLCHGTGTQPSPATKPKASETGRVPGFTYAWMIPYITRIGVDNGWGIAVHGSMCRDLDLLAVPWTDEAIPANELIAKLCKMTDGELQQETAGTEKPHGRKAYTITFKGAWHFIDLSIVDNRTTAPASATGREDYNL